jgi:hypothetical protein
LTEALEIREQHHKDEVAKLWLDSLVVVEKDKGQGENLAKSDPFVQEPCVACAFTVYALGHGWTDIQSDGQADREYQHTLPGNMELQVVQK